MIGVYIHIPFCRTMCPYCDFVKRKLPEGSAPEPFVDAICMETSRFSGPDQCGSVFLGGGTPSLLAPAALERVLSACRSRFELGDPEITVEANPDDVTRDLVRAWNCLGVTRVSLGVQSFDDAMLQYLGRRHDAAGAHMACEIVADIFQNWSLDLIFALPSPAAFERSLEAVQRLAPPHLSAYGLTYEPATPFGARADEAVDDDTYLTQYHMIPEKLSQLCQYEVSNYAKKGFECRHNLVYWRNGQYAGFGPGAYSYVDGVRARNHVALEAYLNAPGAKAEALHLTPAEERLETVIQHLRLAAGISGAEYAARFGRSLEADFGRQLGKLVQAGLLVRDGGSYRPTPSGFDLNNGIALGLMD